MTATLSTQEQATSALGSTGAHVEQLTHRRDELRDRLTSKQAECDDARSQITRAYASGQSDEATTPIVARVRTLEAEIAGMTSGLAAIDDRLGTALVRLRELEFRDLEERHRAARAAGDEAVERLRDRLAEFASGPLAEVLDEIDTVRRDVSQTWYELQQARHERGVRYTALTAPTQPQVLGGDLEQLVGMLASYAESDAG
jgi:chromosome segregation ATPase